MIAIDLGTIEYYDSENNRFDYYQGGIVRFEYSLKVVYDWEARWRKPFLKGDLTDEEMTDFYMRMALDPIDPQFMVNEVMSTLSDYIGDSQTATTFTTIDEGQNGNKWFSKGKIYTAEEIYALMFAANVPMEFESRNLNRLLTVLRIMSNHNTAPKKMSTQDIYKQNAELNAKRKAQFQTKG